MKGATSSTLTNKDKKAITKASAKSMNVNETFVTFQGYTATQSASKASLTSILQSRLFNKVSDLAVTYDITATVRTSLIVVETAAATTYNTLTKSLEDASKGTTFTINLQQAAAEAGSTTLSTAAVAGVSNTPMEAAPLGSADDSDEEKLSGGAVAGIVIGVVLGTIAIAALIYYFCLGSKTTKVGIAPGTTSAVAVKPQPAQVMY
jgi:cell wall integrity and stress response component